MINQAYALILNILLNPTYKSGGFSWRVYTGYLLNVTGHLNAGPEIGFSSYYKTTKNENTNGLTSVLSSIAVLPDPPIGIQYSSNAKIQGYGFDLLANVAYSASTRISLYAKPGIQLAHEKTSYNADLQLTFPERVDNEVIIPAYAVSYPAQRSTSTSMVAPEIIVGTSWQVIEHAPVFLGASYQYVFATHSWNNNI